MKRALIALFLLSTLSVFAQELPDAPSHVKVWDKEFTLTTVAIAGASAFDIETTVRNYRDGFGEHNPVLRGMFGGQPTRPQMYVAIGFADSCATAGAAWLKLRGHRRWARAVQWTVFSIHMAGGAWNLANVADRSGQPDGYKPPAVRRRRTE